VDRSALLANHRSERQVDVIGEDGVAIGTETVRYVSRMDLVQNGWVRSVSVIISGSSFSSSEGKRCADGSADGS
jgi:hypothetical protein